MKSVCRNIERMVIDKLLVLVAALFLVSNFNLFGQDEIYFSKIGIEEGLSQLTVMALFEDELGNMWFGTREGVSVYNGTSMKNISPKQVYENALSGSLIRNIVGDLNGSVFIHTQNGIDKYDLRTEKIFNLVKMQVDAMSFSDKSLWYAKDNKIYKIRENREELFSEIDENVRITAIRILSDRRIVAGTLSSGLFEVDSLGISKRLLSCNSRVSSLFEDRYENIWMGTWEEGLFRISADGGVLNFREDRSNLSKNLSSDFVRAVCEDDFGNIWIGTKLGLDKLDGDLSKFYHYDSKVNDQKSLSNESVWSLCKDRRGNIWAGTYYGGANYFNPESNLYTLHDLKNGSFANRPFPIISRIIEYKDDVFLLCTEGNGLIYYDAKSKTYGTYENLKNENIKSAYLDKENEILYLGLHLGGLSVFDLKSGKLKRFPDIRPERNQSNIVREIIPYKDRYLIATYNGLYLFDESEETFTLFSPELDEYLTYFIDIDIDQNDNLWIASRGLYRYHIPTKQVTPYFFHAEGEKSISNNNITKVLVDNGNNVWIGTSGGGVNFYNRDLDSFTVFNSTTSGLNNDYVSNLLESTSGNLYITTTRGLSMLSQNRDKIINLVYKNGFPLNSLFNGGITRTARGEIYVAGMNGMVSFTDEMILGELPPVNLHFSDLWVNNRKIMPNDATGLLKSSMPFVSKLKFNHEQSIVRLEFSSDNLLIRDKYKYLYKVGGLSEQWLVLREGVREIDLINLNPGKYRLELKAVSPNSETLLGQAKIDFRITPPFFKSTYAYALYFMAFMLLLFQYFRYLKYKIKLRTSLEFEKKEKEHLEEVNRMKLQFFTNISHEFRTPLTLISSQTDILLQSKKLDSAAHGNVLSIDRNTKMMQRLINELLDFRKAVNEKLSVKVVEQDVVDFIREIYDSFDLYAKYKRVNFELDLPDGKAMLWFDPLQMQKVFFNVISNAFKYTPENGSIIIRVKEDVDTVSITVEDTGLGISKQDIDKIFQRFYQADNSRQKPTTTSGTGLGLALTKLIVNAHHAEINVESELGSGSRFEVVMPKGFGHFTEKEIASRQNGDTVSEEYIRTFLSDIQVQDDLTDKPSKKSSTILIVEDNLELLQLLSDMFESEYRVITATNGEEGLSKTLEHQPDIVLSDWMMPVMSGSEMCLKIKSNFAVCHIPVILLTAKVGVEHNMESLKLGADDYITKPFNVNLLLARCNNLVAGRKLLQEKFAQSDEFNPQSVASNEMDKNFLERASDVIEENIENPDFNIDEFSRKMNLSRTGLFNKIKGVTGQTPNEFIINMKMKKASFLLTNHPEFNITDITYQLGFNSPKYFSKCFKNQFGVTPSEYRQTSRQE